ncbi:MAG: RsiV family protein [Phocaeicola sp.]|uniref:RsiV family protein n=1 Tax=Phocaeicola sp. TaxID=2773926 RepID=UPI003F9FDC10
MKLTKLCLSVLFPCALFLILLAGCNKKEQNVNYTFKTIEKEQTYHLNDQTNAPHCTFKLKYSYIDESAGDSISKIINNIIRKQILSLSEDVTDAQSAVDLYYNNYIASYKDEIAELYKEDQKLNRDANEIPSWYNYEYNQETSVEQGKAGILNYKSVVTDYRGGAHPNTIATWLCIDVKTGKLLTLDDLFIPGAKDQLLPLIKDELVKVKAEQHKDMNIKTFDDLREQGILFNDDGDIFVPDNFILGADGITFLYNRYDISSYAEGSMEITLPYSAISKYMIKN